jgi:hypothetical protein
MIEDIIFDSLIFVYETPEETPGGKIYAYSYDGDNFDAGGGGGETSVVFIN